MVALKSYRARTFQKPTYYYYYYEHGANLQAFPQLAALDLPV